MRQVTISINVMKWLVFIFNATTVEKRKIVKRWNMKDHFSEFFCTLKYNESGRYISFIAIQGGSKSIIITPESPHKEDWGNIAHKFTNFINDTNRVKNPIPSRNRQTEISYKEAFKNSRWMTEETKTAHITARNNKISVIGGSRTESDLLSRCLVGKFQLSPKETPTLSDVRKWACNSWKSTFGVKCLQHE